jgi:DNA-binding MarR family transcriptional regulator
MADFAPDLLHRLVGELDRAADRLLRAHLDITFSRAIFLFTLQRHGTVTQHELAVALGYSDPAVSTMLRALRASGFVTTARSPEHGRKRLVSITAEGRAIVRKGRALLAADFGALMDSAGVNEERYSMLTTRILDALLRRVQA